LSDSKTWYFHIMKLAYALLITSHKLSHYFQAHQIKVHTSPTLGEILNNREVTRKIAKRAIELSMHDIIYKPRTAIKAQALSDSIAEWIETQALSKERELEYWIINFDGSLQLQGAGAGILVTSPKGESFKYVLQMPFPAFNNAAEYEALLHGLRISRHSASTNSRFSGTHCSWSIRPTKGGHVWMTKCCYIGRRSAS
jgi:hypothetical protein